MTSPPNRLKWSVIRALLGTVGRTSKGIRTGYRHGFDSGTMLDYVYVNQARGLLGIGRLIDRVYLNAIGWRAIRARRDLLQEVLRQEIARRPGREVFILDVAAGPGRYLQDLIAPYPPGRVRVLCRDLAGPGLWQGERLARERGLDNIAYEMGDALAPRVPPEGPPDIIVVSGLYELLLDDATIQKSLTHLHTLLAPGGTLTFTTQTHHPQLDFIANVLPNRNGDLWVMKCRPAEEPESWALAAGFTATSTRSENLGLFTVTTCTPA
ncbi:class I SAM-dependent methyltransferase family protein [Streptomyces sp. NBC_01381]|uniref:class I SAM-dependent methyltransferase family protein n=1 Tax=Streptomyces sp. NBC_01381 TaxID=2903845 RepID=UPI002252D49A|nr:class I SAM-dependent methyltransferase family protein [Streptomyces sp. NBC_01381]MCX4669934.1 class I SAM-dependent methyltransferase family protein [Streptomyces sp. NBC_01381]